MFFLSFIYGFVQYCLLCVSRIFRTERKLVWENLVRVWRSAVRISAECGRFLCLIQTWNFVVFAGMCRRILCRNALEEDCGIPFGDRPAFFFFPVSVKTISFWNFCLLRSAFGCGSFSG
ncbi:MAG: hypothetical protein E7029_11915 [Planctomycetaceae bacterium]|nr:hypothetical protein [Planctomycetaceae bacterium]